MDPSTNGPSVKFSTTIDGYGGPQSPTEDIKELVRLCRTGRLHDVEKWLASGKPLGGMVAKRKTLLQIAVDTGFHSLVELIRNVSAVQKIEAVRAEIRPSDLEVIAFLISKTQYLTTCRL